MIGAYPSYEVGDLDGLRETIDRWLAEPEWAKGIAARLSTEIAARHTYRHRLAAALETMGLPPCA